MPDMTLQEALQTDEVKGYLSGLIQEAVDEALPTAVEAGIEARMPAIRESVREEVDAGARVRGLASEARSLIEAAKLPNSAKANLLEDYGLVAGDDDKVTPGRALALIEAQVDADDKVVKSAKAVLREAIDSDVKRVRNVLREAAPSVPRAPGGGEGGETPVAFGGEGSAWAQRLRDSGMDPATFGATPTPTPAT